MANLKRFPTRTGCIFVDMDKRVEFLYVGDYGQENNIKAEFLGLNKEINGVPHHDVDLGYKLVVTISTQKGCPMHEEKRHLNFISREYIDFLNKSKQ